MYVFQKYKSLYIDDDIKTLLKLLPSMKVVCLSGIRHVGKTNLCENLQTFYEKSVELSELKEFEIESLENEAFLLNKSILLIIKYDRKFRQVLKTFIKHSSETTINIIIECSPNEALNFESFCFIHRLKCPEYETKLKVLEEISMKEYGHKKNAMKIAKQYNTWHDCLISIELMESNKYIFPYSEICCILVRDIKKYEVKTYRKYVYSLLMCYINFSVILKHMMLMFIEKRPDISEMIVEKTAFVEALMVQGNKEVYYFEMYMLIIQKLFFSEKEY